MEIINPTQNETTPVSREPETRQIIFYGEGGPLFSIYIVNLLLCIVTLGFYYPWAKAATLRYLYQETDFESTRFTFHGTGKEMFKGYIKAVLYFAVVYGIVIGLTLTNNVALAKLGIFIFYIAIILILPFAIHGSLRYRLSRSSWRGIHFGYRGSLKELCKQFFTGILLVVVTFGIYASWLRVKLTKYVMENIRFGNMTMSFHGKGEDLFWLQVKGTILSILTLGIYLFRYMRNLFNYYADNTQLHLGGETIQLKSYVTGWDYFALTIGNLFIIIFTLGLGTPWVIIRNLNFIYKNLIMEGFLDVNLIAQTEEEYRDATGDDITDMLDLNII